MVLPSSSPGWSAAAMTGRPHGARRRAAGKPRVPRERLAEGFHQQLLQAWEGADEFLMLPLEPGHHRTVLLRPDLPGVKRPRLHDLGAAHSGSDIKGARTRSGIVTFLGPTAALLPAPPLPAAAPRAAVTARRRHSPRSAVRTRRARRCGC